MAIDLLAFGPHPDDIEIGLGGTIARYAAEGRSVVLIDLTRGELGSNGTPAERQTEATAAARVLGASIRENLGWPDGGFATTEEFVRSAVDAIRRHKPRTVAVPYWHDRHPDHVRASEVLSSAAFTSALRRYETDREAWRADWVCYYFINDGATPSFVIDVSAHYEKKQAALDCYRSQFGDQWSRAQKDPADIGDVAAAGDVTATRLNAPTFRRLIESRDAQFGARAGVLFAEGIVVREPIQRATLLKHPA